MAQFYPLNVISVEQETRDAVVVTLLPNADDAARFAFTQGQYLTFRQEFDGEDVRRSYSICAAPSEGHLRVGIKKVAGGCFSTWANENLKVGDFVEAMSPLGSFQAPLQPEQKRHYLGFAAGSGITPLISIIKTVLTEEPKSTFTLVYGNKSPMTVMFRDELDDLKNYHMNRLSLIHVLGSENDLDLFSGRIDREKTNALLDGWIDASHADMAFVCGPEEMMLNVSAVLEENGMTKEQIKFELFGTSQKGRAAQHTVSNDDGRAGETYNAMITVDGVTREVDIAKSGQSILEAALGADLGAPFSCKAGVCSTCRAKVIKGESEMLANYALEDYEVERGYVLACQCYPLSDNMVIDFDQ